MIPLTVLFAEPQRDRLEARRFRSVIEIRFDVGTVHDFTKTTQGTIRQAVFDKDRFKATSPTNVPELGSRDIERLRALVPRNTVDLF